MTGPRALFAGADWRVAPLRPAVVSVTAFRTETDADNVIPGRVDLRGTVRTLDPETRDLAETRLNDVVRGVAGAFGAEVEIDFLRDYPVTVNAEAQAAFAGEVAREVAGPERVDDAAEPVMGAEDFSFMLNARPGAFIFVGNGDSAALHNPGYDFNDEAIPAGCSFWARLVEKAMPAA